MIDIDHIGSAINHLRLDGLIGQCPASSRRQAAIVSAIALGGSHMRRREFVTLLCGAVASWPLAAHAKSDAKLPTIGFLIGGTPSSDRLWIDAFVQHLRELGWVDGSNIHIQYRSAEGRSERYTEIAAEFVRMRVDIILTSGAAAVAAAKKATTVIPIVFAAVGDPVGGGLVASLAKPGGNLTGLSLQFTDISSKRVELLRKIRPDLRRLGILSNVSSPSAVLEMQKAQATARTLGLEVVTPTLQRPEDIETAFEAFKDRVEAGRRACTWMRSRLRP
jgi:putative tryptophan/tyrosine transport system substrate-binding protein